ncbi:MAG: TlpA family protein disulfide reductase [Flavobacteriales bacterium]
MRFLSYIFLLLAVSIHAQEEINLPDFSIKNSKGKVVTKDSITNSGKITLLNFWASSCRPCKDEMLEISRIKSDVEFENVVFVSVSIDNDEAVVNAKDWFKRNKCSWNLYFDTKQDLFNKVLTATENTSTAIPVSIVINKSGQIVSFITRFAQETYKEELVRIIKEIERN